MAECVESKTKPILQEPAGSVGKVLPAGLIALVLTTAFVATMCSTYLKSGDWVTLAMGEKEWRSQTHQQTVGAFLREIGLDLQPADIVLPPPDSPLQTGQTIVVQKASPILVEADGQVIERYTHSRHVVDLLREAGVTPKPYDVVMLDGKPAELDTPLPAYQWEPDHWAAWRSLTPRPAAQITPRWSRLQLQRAVPLSISDNGMRISIHTVARTVGEALLSQNIALYLGDLVQPALGTLLATGLHVEIHRANPVAIQVDGGLIRTRTQTRNVAQLLSEADVELLDKDYTVPGLDAGVTNDMLVRVVRVVEDWLWETEDMPFETVRRADSKLELDQQRTDQPGKVGIRKRQVYITYEDGERKERAVAAEWVERQPATRVVSYGTKIVVQELQTPSGPIRYWRKIRMLATSYTAGQVGKNPDHPDYGLTRLGWRARKGIVAVDPRVISLRSEVYVPGYGFGTAADTGGMIKGRWIDLCYDEEDWVPWKKWVDVYLLEPIPDADEIKWILPDYPTERR